MHRYIDPKDFEGKTIKRVEAKAINITRFYFTDGTAIAIEIDSFGNGLMGMVACDMCAQGDGVKDGGNVPDVPRVRRGDPNRKGRRASA